jgi:hypothetical protein
LSINISISHQNNLVVSQLFNIEIFVHTCAKCGD